MIFLQQKPSFDTWTSLFLFVALQAVFVFMVLFNLKRGNKSANKLLGLLLLAFALILVCYVTFWTGYYIPFPYFNGWYIPLLYLSAPLFYLYLSCIIDDRSLTRKDYFHFVPTLIILVLLTPLLLSAYVSEPQVLRTNFRDIIVLGTSPIIQIIYIGTYVVLSYRLYFINRTEESYLNTWFQYILGSFSGYYVTIVTYYILINFSFFNPTWDYMISLAMSFFVFVVSFLGYIYPQALSGKPLSSITNPFKYKNSGLTENAEQLLKDELIKCMEEQELYKYQLSLEELATKLNSNRHNVSLVINKYFEGNYFEFLNRYRIEYVKKLLINPEFADTPIIQLAYDAGFNNKVSFNKAFKKFTGVTPMTFRATKGKIKSDS